MSFVAVLMTPPTCCETQRSALPERITRLERSFAFGPFILGPERQMLLKDGVRLRIGGRALDILTALVERPGDVISKRELFARAWPDTFVHESNLKVNIASLRRILGEHPAAAQYIATVAGRGYRFIADVFFSGLEVETLPAGSTPHLQ